MKRYVWRSLQIFALLFCVIVTQVACGEKELDRATKASGTIAKYTGQVISIVDVLWTTGVIKDIKVKDLIAQKLKDFSVTGKDFNDLIIKYSLQYASGTVPTSVWKDIITHFDELSKVFLDLLTQIPQLAGLQDSKAFRFISAGVVALANIFLNISGVPKLILKSMMPNYAEVVQRAKDIKQRVPNQSALMSEYYAEAA